MPLEELPICACGCGRRLVRSRASRKNRKFIHGHNARGVKPRHLKQIEETRAEDDSIFIPLSNRDSIAIVDRLDYPLVKPFTWRAAICRRKGVDRYLYAVTDIFGPTGSKLKKSVRMHRLILEPDKDFLVDHADGNTLNNRRSNLRICTTAQNCQNQFARQGGTSHFKGVCFCRWTGRWRVQLQKEDTKIWIGRFDSEIEAAEAYDRGALLHFGPFANLNFGPERAAQS